MAAAARPKEGDWARIAARRGGDGVEDGPPSASVGRAQLRVDLVDDQLLLPLLAPQGPPHPLQRLHLGLGLGLGQNILGVGFKSAT